MCVGGGEVVRELVCCLGASSVLVLYVVLKLFYKQDIQVRDM